MKATNEAQRSYQNKGFVLNQNEFEIVDETSYVGDPCYDDSVLESGCAHILPLKPGVWRLYSLYAEGRNGRGGRPVKFVVVHEDHPNAQFTLSDTGKTIAVDSGLVSVFSMSAYPLVEGEVKEHWYNGAGNKKSICNLMEKAECAIHPSGRGVVSSTLWGDGKYPLATDERNGLIVGLSIDFDPEEPEEEDEYDEEEEYGRNTEDEEYEDQDEHEE